MKTIHEIAEETLQELHKIKDKIESRGYSKLDIIYAAVNLEKLKNINSDITTKLS